MADCPTGLELVRDDKAICANVIQDCAYAVCSDPSGDQCYGIDSRTPNYIVGSKQFEYSCETYCPSAFEDWYPPSFGNNPRCCNGPGKILSCSPDPNCICKDLEDLASKLPPLPSSAPYTPSSALSTPSPSPTTSSPTDAGTPTAGPNTAPGGLSTGAKAGIGVGAVLGAAVLLGLAFWLGWILRKRRKSAVNLSHDLPTGETETKYNANSMWESNHRAHEGPGELPGTTVDHELDGREVPAEAGH